MPVTQDPAAVLFEVRLPVVQVVRASSPLAAIERARVAITATGLDVADCGLRTAEPIRG